MHENPPPTAAPAPPRRARPAPAGLPPAWLQSFTDDGPVDVTVCIAN